MKNTFGNSITLTLFGESHGERIGAVLDGIAPGITIDKDYISAFMRQRSAAEDISTGRKEADEVHISSGVFNGRTTGTPVLLTIDNENTDSSDYEKNRFIPRPSHADYTAEVKYKGFQDYRGGGHFSGRLTAPIVAAGSVCRYALEQKGIFIGTHIKECGGIPDASFDNYETDINALNAKQFPVISEEKGEKIRAKIEKAKADGDSVGGILETAVIGLSVGVGEPWFDSLESMLSHALFSVPGIKGIEFGAGFAFADMTGSEANDPFTYENGRVVTETNNNGGINGGVSNGMPLLFSCVVKPTPSIAKKQSTVDLSAEGNTGIEISGRHDPAIVHRARAVVDALTAFVLYDMLSVKYGTDFFSPETK